MNEKLIKQLQEGEIAVHNDGTLEELREVLRYAFPKDDWPTTGTSKYYKSYESNLWISTDKTNLPSYSVKEFLKEEFVLPEKWCIKLTKENKQTVQNWRIKNHYYCDINEGHFIFENASWSFNNEDNELEITFEQFKQKYLNMEEKKIIGYKLTKPEYNDVAIKIAKIENPSWSGFKENNFLKSNEKCRDYLGYVENLKKAGVLDLWFEAVYEEEVQLPIINGYKGEISGDRHTHVVTYGCAILSVNKLKRILDACNTVGSSGAGNREVKAFVLDSGVEVTLKEIEQIVKYRDAKSIY